MTDKTTDSVLSAFSYHSLPVTSAVLDELIGI